MFKVCLLIFLTLTKFISQIASSPLSPPPEVKSCDQINVTAKITFYNDEDFEGCSPLMQTLMNGCPQNLGNNSFSSMIVEEPKELERVCLVLFPTELCMGNNHWIVKNQKNVSQFGNFNDIVRCFRICNEKERERSSTSDTTEAPVRAILTTKEVTTEVASTTSTSKINIVKTVSLRFYQHEGYKGLRRNIVVRSGSCVNLNGDTFSSVLVISQKPSCVELFSHSECRSMDTLTVRDDVPVFGSLNDKVKSLRICNARL